MQDDVWPPSRQSRWGWEHEPHDEAIRSVLSYEFPLHKSPRATVDSYGNLVERYNDIMGRSRIGKGRSEIFLQDVQSPTADGSLHA